MKPTLYIVVPCFNEEAVLPLTAPMFSDKIRDLCAADVISDKSRVLFVDDGSRDKTWKIISSLAKSEKCFCGVKLSRNRGHQNALLAGLDAALDKCDITITADCDGQDDIDAVDKMIAEYLNGADIVYGVRSDRSSDTSFKRNTARLFYKIMTACGVETVYDHADYRLLSNRALAALFEFKEVNLFLRGMIPLVGFKSTAVQYKRNERIAGETHYPLNKMISFAIDGITGLSVKPIRFITAAGVLLFAFCLLGLIASAVAALSGADVSGTLITVLVICLVCGVQLVSTGVIGEYIGKIYLETKHRPRYIIEETENLK